MLPSQKIRILRAKKNAYSLKQSLLSEQNQSDAAQELAAQMPAGAVVSHAHECVVTEVGFVTMAVLPAFAREIDNWQVIPGADDRNRRGFLVMIPDRLPYHSLCATPEAAVREARAATGRADALVAHYGSKPALRSAAKSAPWHLMVQPQDITRAGICAWGADSFLRRVGLRKVAFSFGLPSIVLRVAGAYGARLTATALLRQEWADNRCQDIPTGLNDPA